MAKPKKICKNCKIFVEQEKCPICQGNQFLTTWKGRIIMLKPEESEIAKKLGITKKGIYAIKSK